MPDTHLTQAEADALLAMLEVASDPRHYLYPPLGGTVAIPLESVNRREFFLLDLSRGRIDLRKVKYQMRGRTVVTLARIDLGGPAHRNPDGTEVRCPHLHLYREGFAARWAFPLDADAFPYPQDLWRVLDDFLSYCNVVQPPVIDRGIAP